MIVKYTKEGRESVASVGQDPAKILSVIQDWINRHPGKVTPNWGEAIIPFGKREMRVTYTASGQTLDVTEVLIA